MDWSEIVEQIKPYHGLQDPELELPAILLAFAHTQARRFLEIGTYQGGTAAAVALAYPEAEVFTVDLRQPERAICNAQPKRLQGIAFELLCPGRVTQLYLDAADLGILLAAPPLVSRRFDMVFVDGDHRPGAVLRDLRNCAKLLAHDGALLVHDYTDERDPAPQPHWTRWVHDDVHRFADESGFTVERVAGIEAGSGWTWLALLHPPDAPEVVQ